MSDSLGWGRPQAKSGDISAATLARAELLFLGRTLRFGLAITTTRAALTARTAPARAAWAPRWPHLLQLFELLGCQDLLELRLYLSFQGRHLLLLILG